MEVHAAATAVFIGDWLQESCSSSSPSSSSSNSNSTAVISSICVVDVAKVSSLIPSSDDARKEILQLADTASLDIAIIAQPFRRDGKRSSEVDTEAVSSDDDKGDNRAAASCERPAILCKTCGSYLNKYCQLVRKKTNFGLSGRIGSSSSTVFDWYCCFCGSYNDCFFNAYPSTALASHGDADSDKEKLQYLKHIFPETTNCDVTYQVPISNNSGSCAGQGGQPRVGEDDSMMMQIFVFDERTLCDAEAMRLFEDSLSLVQTRLGRLSSSSSGGHGVCIIVALRHSLHLMKFNEKRISYHNVVEFDASSDPQISLCSGPFKKNIIQNKHIFKIGFILENIVVISSALRRVGIANSASRSNGVISSIFENSNRSSSCVASSGTAITANDVIDVATAISKTNNSAIVHLNFMIMRNMYVLSDQESAKVSSSSSQQSTTSGVAERFASLGRACASRGLFIDIFHGGLANSAYDCLDSLAGATGGLLIVSERFSDLALKNSYLRIVSGQIIGTAGVTDITGDHSAIDGGAGSKYSVSSRKILACLEVKASINLAVNKVIGPVVAAVGTDSGGGSRAHTGVIDRSSVRYTLAECHSAGGGSAQKSLDEREADMVSQIEAYNCTDSTAAYFKACGISRCADDDTFSIQLHPVHQNNARYIDGSKTYAFVQIRSRYYYRNSRNECFLRTRSQTLRLLVVTDIRDYCSGLNADVYSLVVARGIVADFHDYGIQKYGGAIDRQADSQYDGDGSDRPSIIESLNSLIDGLYRSQRDAVNTNTVTSARAAATRYIDNISRALCVLRTFSHSGPARTISGHNYTHRQDSVSDLTVDANIDQVLKAMYHLREGSLLDGPATYAQESYHLRSHFLQTQRHYSTALLMPRVRLFITRDGNDSDRIVVSDAIDAPTDTMSLAAGSISIVDLGDNILVRGHYCGNHQSQYGVLLAAVAAEARVLSSIRFPSSNILVLGSPFSPQERMICARLNPLHRDNLQVVKMSMPPVLLGAFASDDAILGAGEHYPLTDQQTFFMFLSAIDSQYASKKLQFLRKGDLKGGKEGYMSAPTAQHMTRDPIRVKTGSISSSSKTVSSGSSLASTIRSYFPWRGDPSSSAGSLSGGGNEDSL